MDIGTSGNFAMFGWAGAVLTVAYHFYQIKHAIKAEREEFKAEVIQEAKQGDLELKNALEARREVLYNELESKIDALSAKLHVLETSVDKEFGHMRDAFNGELKNLSGKLEDLRTELRGQHGQLVGLLGKMIDRQGKD